MSNQYQTWRIPKDSIEIKGAYPTVEWFNKFEPYINFADKVVLDLGCAEASYGIESLWLGARKYIGVDIESEKLQRAHAGLIANNMHNDTELVCKAIEDYEPTEEYDVVIFSMILHWLKGADAQLQRFAQQAKDKVVVVYRHQWPDGQEQGYRPTVKEMTELLGLPKIHDEVIAMDKARGQYVVLVVYDAS